MSKKQIDIIVSAIIAAAGLAFGILSLQYRGLTPWNNDPGADFLPLIYCSCIVILAGVNIFSCLKNKDPEYGKKEENAERSHEDRIDFLRALGTVALIALYAWTFERVGFLVNSILYLFLQQLILTKKGNRHWVRIAVISVVLPIFCQVFFVNILNYMLPSGILYRWM